MLRGEAPATVAARLQRELIEVREQWLARRQAAYQEARAKLRLLQEAREQVEAAFQAEKN
jgi:hypothetical protein